MSQQNRNKELPREASGEVAGEILSQSSRGSPARKLQHSCARNFFQPCLSNVLGNLIFGPIDMGVVVFSLMREWWIMLRLQIFLTYLLLKMFLKYLKFRRNVRSDKSEL